MEDMYGGADGMYGAGGDEQMYGDGGGDWDDGEQNRLLEVLFAALDADADSWISPAELRQGLAKQAVSYAEHVQAAQTAEVSRAHADADANHDGGLSADEFDVTPLYMQHAEAVVSRAKLFAFADVDGDSRVSALELKALVFADGGGRFTELRAMVSVSALGAQQGDASSKLAFAEVSTLLRSGEEEGAADGDPWYDAGMRREYEQQQMEAADKDGDGELDAHELGNFLLPSAAEPPARMAEEEATRLGALADERGGFDLETVTGAPQEFFEAFAQLLRLLVEGRNHEGAYEQGGEHDGIYRGEGDEEQAGGERDPREASDV